MRARDGGSGGPYNFEAQPRAFIGIVRITLVTLLPKG
jgi:hypothetical protein